MQLKLATVYLLFISLVAFSSYAQHTSKSNKYDGLIQSHLPLTINFNKNWQFKRVSPREKEAKLEQIDLPHTPKIEPLLVNNQWQGTAIYQKTFRANKEWKNKRVYIRFEAAMSHASIWLNDVKLTEHLGGYLPFSVDLTNHIKFDQDNLLHVTLTNTDNPNIGPKPLHRLDFNTYGGLYRDVNLIIKDPLHITDEIHANKVASGGVVVKYPKITTDHSIIEVQTHIANKYKINQQFVLKQYLLFKGQKVASTVQKNNKLLPSTEQQFKQQLEVHNAQLWSPQTPNLYQLVSEIYVDDKLIDHKETRIGLRTFEFDEQHQLLINGKVTYLRGVNRHQEYPHVGYAISSNADYRDAVKIKSAGFDYVRLSHYPHAKAFMDAADELGLVLLPAILGWQFYVDTPDFRAQILQSCRDLIRRDRNHPSVLAWECSLNETWMPATFVQQLIDVVHDEDTTRLAAGWLPEYDMYLQARQHRKNHNKIPAKPYSVSEYGDWEYFAQNAGLNQHTWKNLKAEERNSRQLLNAGEKRLLQQATNLHEAHNDNFSTPAFADGYWVMFDYNRGVADDIEASGIMSIHRLPKYSYYFFQSQRSPLEKSALYQSGPMVFIANEWQPNSSTNVRVFSNTDEVHLWLNGELIAKNKPTKNEYSTHLAHPPFEFNLTTFEPGQLIAKGYIDNKLVAEYKVSTPSAPTQLVLTIDSSGKAPEVGVNDLVFVYAELLDNQGNPVPLNDINIDFSVAGDIEIIHTKSALTFQGKAAILLKIGQSLQGAKITANAKDLGITSSYLNNTTIE